MENHGKNTKFPTWERNSAPMSSSLRIATLHVSLIIWKTCLKKRFFGGLSLIDIDDGLPSQYNINTAIWEEPIFWQTHILLQSKVCNDISF